MIGASSNDFDKKFCVKCKHLAYDRKVEDGPMGPMWKSFPVCEFPGNVLHEIKWTPLVEMEIPIYINELERINHDNRCVWFESKDSKIAPPASSLFDAMKGTYNG